MRKITIDQLKEIIYNSDALNEIIDIYGSICGIVNLYDLPADKQALLDDLLNFKIPELLDELINRTEHVAIINNIDGI